MSIINMIRFAVNLRPSTLLTTYANGDIIEKIRRISRIVKAKDVAAK